MVRPNIFQNEIPHLLIYGTSEENPLQTQSFFAGTVPNLAPVSGNWADLLKFILVGNEGTCYTGIIQGVYSHIPYKEAVRLVCPGLRSVTVLSFCSPRRYAPDAGAAVGHHCNATNLLVLKPKGRGTFLRFPLIRILVFLGLYWGPLLWGTGE